MTSTVSTTANSTMATAATTTNIYNAVPHRNSNIIGMHNKQYNNIYYYYYSLKRK